MSAFHRLLSRKEKHADVQHDQKNEPQDSQGPLNGVFVSDYRVQKPEKDEDAKIKSIQHRLLRSGVHSFKDSDISYVLHTTYANGDKDKAYELFVLFEDSQQGKIHPYQLGIKLLGAVNRNGVTCWLDSLLFAMFARLENFEVILQQNFDEHTPRQRLATLLRLWVNALRAGKLITIDITKQIQTQLAACGWKEAAELCQHDVSEAFTFLTETLDLPLLSLKMDLYHFGKEDKDDDHKIIQERLLELAVPEQPPDGQQIKLEDCLEMYFNNKVEVRRYLEEIQRRNTLSSVRSWESVDSSKNLASHVEVAEVGASQPSSPIPQSAPEFKPPVRPSFQRHRAPSIIQEHYIDEKRGLLGSDSDAKSPRLRREVMMPAFQFFRLIPWYTENKPTTDAQVAAHFNHNRPILGIALKRYGMLPNGAAFKRRTHIDIPIEIGLPHFIAADSCSEEQPFGNFKLSLQSVVCHQGISTESGHYIALVRSPDPLGQGQDSWMRLDDLAKERVKDINIEEWLKGPATPYLLFYQVMPIGEPLLPTSVDIAPPSYAESNATQSTTVSTSEESSTHRPMHSDYPTRSNTSEEGTFQRPGYTDQSTAFSTSDQSAIQRESLDTSISEDDRRRPSEILIEESIPIERSAPPSLEHAHSVNRGRVHNLPVAYSGNDPNALTDALMSLKTSRRGSKTTKASSKSRPSSQSGENRLSNSFHRLTNRMSRDKLSNMPAQVEENHTSNVPLHPDKHGESTKLKKEARAERFKQAAKDYQMISKGKKPDRECVVM